MSVAPDRKYFVLPMNPENAGELVKRFQALPGVEVGSPAGDQQTFEVTILKASGDGTELEEALQDVAHEDAIIEALKL